MSQQQHMSVIAAIDHHQSTVQRGENDHVEHAWTQDNLQEQTTQLFFQLVRTAHMDPLMQQLDTILKTLATTTYNQDATANEHLDLLYRMLLHTRDTVSGKGEYALAYRMVLTWYKYFPALATRAVERFVLPPPDQPSQQPLGSWKDLKYLAECCKKTTGNAEHKLIRTCIRLINTQLELDTITMKVSDPLGPTDPLTPNRVSLCAKWVPREGSRYGWLFKKLAEDHAGLNTGTIPTDPAKAKKRAYMIYRKRLADLNRHLDTIQIKQCGNVWAEIDHHKTTSITLSRNKKALLNLTKQKEQRSERPDRIQCAENFTKYVEGRVKTGKEIKGRKVAMNDFTTMAIKADTETEIALVNAQWKSSSAAIHPRTLGNMVAMVDTSSSMNGDPLHAAIALGIRVAENSVLGKRVLTFHTTPTWHNLEDRDDFVSMVQSLQDASWAGSTNFYAALMLILDALVAQKVPPEDVEGLVFAIFSDMQINLADPKGSRQDMQETIQKRFQDAGYTCPHLLFWNLRSTSGFPTISSKPNTTMMSGFSPALLNAFCEQGVEALQSVTPWNMLKDVLNHERYAQ